MRVLKAQKTILPTLAVSIDKKTEGIMIPVFEMEMGSWYKELGEDINSTLESGEYSPLLKATLLYFFFNKFDLSAEITSMFQFFPTFKDIL